MSTRTNATLSYSQTKIISLSWNEYWRGEDCLRVCTFGPEIPNVQGDEISGSFIGGAPSLKVKTCDEAVLEAEWEIFT